MKDDIVIDMLKYGYRNIHVGIKKEEIKEYLLKLNKSFFYRKKKYKDLNAIKFTINVYFDNNFFIPQDKDGNKIGDRYFLNPNGYFRFLQHKSIVTTRVYSTMAIVIAIISIFLSIIINDPAQISEEQIDRFIQLDSIKTGKQDAVSLKLEKINSLLITILKDSGNIYAKRISPNKLNSLHLPMDSIPQSK
ncbi:hypothetical protein [Marinifilum flexuosum]|uniref:hypothetical protein n=1 Tax=Marinifilum flexuosum TaxID=1117708 RepID=UPI00249416BF|nr:hypothetical protein [Marinifilum flexuosum]